MEKFKLLNEPITLDIATQLCSNINFIKFEEYTTCIKNKKLNDFANKNGFSDINGYLNDFLQKNNFASYEEFKSDLEEVNQEIISKLQRDVITNERYPALTTISKVYRICAFIVIVASVIYFLFLWAMVEPLLALVSIPCAFLIVLGLFAASEGIKLFIDIEYNTRQAAKK